jgi:hypothetical protein
MRDVSIPPAAMTASIAALIAGMSSQVLCAAAPQSCWAGRVQAGCTVGSCVTPSACQAAAS